MSYEILRATINEATVAAADAILDTLTTEAADLVATESAIRMICKGQMDVSDGTTTKTFHLDCDVYDDTEAKILLINAQYTGAMTAIEGASTYTNVSSVKIQVKFIVTE